MQKISILSPRLAKPRPLSLALKNGAALGWDPSSLAFLRQVSANTSRVWWPGTKPQFLPPALPSVTGRRGGLSSENH